MHYDSLQSWSAMSKGKLHFLCTFLHPKTDHLFYLLKEHCHVWQIQKTRTEAHLLTEQGRNSKIPFEICNMSKVAIGEATKFRIKILNVAKTDFFAQN